MTRGQAQGFDYLAFQLKKAEILEYIKKNSGKFNGSEIEFDLNVNSLKYLKIQNGKYTSPLGELAKEHKIYYHYGKEKCFYADPSTRLPAAGF
jgi:hypothetical protein